MGGMIPLGDASRRPTRFPVVTIALILANAFVFLLELNGGDAFVLKWSLIPADIVAGHHWITILTAMFMHGSWLHIIGNMVFLWAFGPEIEDAMNPLRYLAFYLLGGLIAILAQLVANPHSTVPNLGASGAMGPLRLGVLIALRGSSFAWGTFPSNVSNFVFSTFIFRPMLPRGVPMLEVVRNQASFVYTFGTIETHSYKTRCYHCGSPASTESLPGSGTSTNVTVSFTC